MIQTDETVAVGADADTYAERYEIYQSLYPTVEGYLRAALTPWARTDARLGRPNHSAYTLRLASAYQHVVAEASPPYRVCIAALRTCNRFILKLHHSQDVQETQRGASDTA